jgi:hypothetical protein
MITELVASGAVKVTGNHFAFLLDVAHFRSENYLSEINSRPSYLHIYNLNKVKLSSAVKRPHLVSMGITQDDKC